ncbi:MAG: hypothetical protein Kow0010_22840 [Dehalococcoidia bacterium]
MVREPFRFRVEALREAWRDRREASQLSARHDYAAQQQLLRLLHGWVTASLSDVREVYGPSLAATIEPDSGEVAAAEGAFTVAIGQGVATFSLRQQRREGAPAWRVASTVTVAGQPLPATSGARARRWTRAKADEILLTLLAAYERSLP